MICYLPITDNGMFLLSCDGVPGMGLVVSAPPKLNLAGRLKMREWKLRYGQKCKDEKCGSGKIGSRLQRWKMHQCYLLPHFSYLHFPLPHFQRQKFGPETSLSPFRSWSSGK